MEIFIKKYIKSEDDLPGKEGFYIIKDDAQDSGMIHNIHFNPSNPKDITDWIRGFDYYLLPCPELLELIKAQQELIERYEREFIKNGLISTGDIIGETRLCKIVNNLRVRIAQLRKEVGI